jgi:hypothetical protein
MQNRQALFAQYCNISMKSYCDPSGERISICALMEYKHFRSPRFGTDCSNFSSESLAVQISKYISKSNNLSGEVAFGARIKV